MDLAGIDGEIGAAVRTARVGVDMSQEDLANEVTRLGYPISQATVGKIERGERKVTIGEAEAIARALKTSTRALVLGSTYLTQQMLLERLLTLRKELMAAMRSFESGQQLVAMETRKFDGGDDSEGLQDLVLESLEDVLDEYRKDRISENTARRARDDMDGPRGNPREIDGLYGEYLAKFGDTVEQIPQAHAWETILKQRQPAPPKGDDG